MSLRCVEEFRATLAAELEAADNRTGVYSGTPSMSPLIRRIHDIVERPLRVVVLGGMNVGKTSLVNLLVGDRIGPTSAATNTRLPVLFRFAQVPRVGLVYADGSRADAGALDARGMAMSQQSTRMIEVGLPLARLRLLEVMDTPGIDNPDCDIDPEQLPIRPSDFAVWITDANQAWKESERCGWEQLGHSREHRCILVVSRIDLLKSLAERAAVLGRLQREAAGAFGAVVPLSLPGALAARDGTLAPLSEALWRDCGGSALENELARAVLEHTRSRIRRARAVLSRALAHHSASAGAVHRLEPLLRTEDDAGIADHRGFALQEVVRMSSDQAFLEHGSVAQQVSAGGGALNT